MSNKISPHNEIILLPQRGETNAEHNMHPKPQQIVTLPESEVGAISIYGKDPIEVRETGHRQSPHKPKHEAKPFHPAMNGLCSSKM